MSKIRNYLAAAAVSAASLCGASAGHAADLIGLSVATLANPFFQGMTKGVQSGIAAHPDLKLINTSANGDANTQTNQVTDLINQHVAALILNPINANSIVPVVKEANKKGIPVFTLDRGAACGGCQVNFLETDNKALGKEGADFIADQLKQRYGSVKGNVVDLEGLLGTTAGDDRERGFATEFEALQKDNPGLKLVARQAADFDADKAFNITTQLLAAHNDIDAVFNGNDDNAVGVVRAIRQANRFKPIGDPKHIVVIGIDGTEQALSSIRRGQMDATLSQNPVTMAQQSVNYVEAYLHGDKSKIPAHQFWPHLLITKATIDSAAAKSYGLWGDEISH
ncbi:sugar ABC transporter substrate-binding protein [Lichenicola cladoniae]|uniref:Sugar ABC transporter substrate-binding protein n=1 Tax=Lichenicola cladoniae TaxID=1484109 RepID=A0A6M8HTT0_9PROT|nr:sugar ABC transporter substrate-binding protein [Lichenicola cladoniae]NPD67761.1 sugar ABC transporter substrate-binding protein [Acetobacteraceae bacterium]QKE91686.1 sugar ABC transporter substrate-binding protein [Lichenicola cladoniae]